MGSKAASQSCLKASNINRAYPDKTGYGIPGRPLILDRGALSAGNLDLCPPPFPLKHLFLSPPAAAAFLAAKLFNFLPFSAFYPQNLFFNAIT